MIGTFAGREYARVLIDPEIAAVSALLRNPDGGVLFEATSEDGETLPRRLCIRSNARWRWPERSCVWAARVMASLWRIPDRATAELVRRLYRAMLTEGLAPSAALRSAQVAMSQDGRWASLHHWAAFVLEGEWR